MGTILSHPLAAGCVFQRQIFLQFIISLIKMLFSEDLSTSRALRTQSFAAISTLFTEDSPYLGQSMPLTEVRGSYMVFI